MLSKEFFPRPKEAGQAKLAGQVLLAIQKLKFWESL
jgi:hypothetical protein